MSTKFKALESINRNAAYELQNAINAQESRLNAISNQNRELARVEIQNSINQLRREQETVNQNIINQLQAQRNETNQQLIDLEIRHRLALNQRANQLHAAIVKQGERFGQEILNLSNETHNRISNLDINLRADMRSQENRINSNINDLRTHTSKIVSDLANNVNKAFEQQQDQINTLDQNIRSTKSEVAQIRDELNQLYTKEGNNTRIANQLMERCSSLIESAKSNVSINRFELDALNAYIGKYNNVSILGLSAPQAVMATAFEIYNGLLDLQEKAQVKQAVFDLLLEETLTSAEALLKIMNHNRNNTFFTNSKGEMLVDENDNQLKVEIDYWMNGAYNELQNRLISLKQDLEGNRNDIYLTLQALESSLSEVKALELKEREMVITAAMRGIASMEREALRDEVIESLKENLFFVQEEGYAGDDLRDATYATLENGNGTNLTVIVKADESLLKNQVLIQRNDENILESAGEAEQIRDIIRASLQANGNEITGLAVRDESHYDTAALSRVKLKEAKI
jgi:archaellum component FlaC